MYYVDRDYTKSIKVIPSYNTMNKNAIQYIKINNIIYFFFLATT